MERMQELGGSFKLSEAEDEVIELEGEKTSEVEDKGARCLIEKILNDRVIGKSIVESTMAKFGG